MLKAFNKMRANWAAARAAEAADLRERKQRAEAEVDRLNVEMTQKYCPFVGGDCRRTCVHFKPGNVFEMEHADYTKSFIAHGPKCRTWKKG